MSKPKKPTLTSRVRDLDERVRRLEAAHDVAQAALAKYLKLLKQAGAGRG